MTTKSEELREFEDLLQLVLRRIEQQDQRIGNLFELVGLLDRQGASCMEALQGHQKAMAALAAQAQAKPDPPISTLN